jgi:hypothetical protein
MTFRPLALILATLVATATPALAQTRQGSVKITPARSSLGPSPTFGTQLTGPVNGCTTAPPYSFVGRTTTGLCSGAADEVSIVTNAIVRGTWGNTALTLTVPFRSPDGSVGATGFGFTSEAGLGFYRLGAGQMVAAAAGERALFSSAGVTVSGGGFLFSPTGSFAQDTALNRLAAKVVAFGPTTGVTLRWSTDGQLDIRNFANSAAGNLTLGTIIATGSNSQFGSTSFTSTVTLASGTRFLWNGVGRMWSSVDGIFHLTTANELNDVLIDTAGGSTGRMLKWGSGAPEGAVTASIGSIYLRVDGGAGTTFCVKETGTSSNTGWVCK